MRETEQAIRIWYAPMRTCSNLGRLILWVSLGTLSRALDATQIKSSFHGDSVITQEHRRKKMLQKHLHAERAFVCILNWVYPVIGLTITARIYKRLFSGGRDWSAR